MVAETVAGRREARPRGCRLRQRSSGHERGETTAENGLWTLEGRERRGAQARRRWFAPEPRQCFRDGKGDPGLGVASHVSARSESSRAQRAALRRSHLLTRLW
jgi:hypothetical protein